MNTDSRGRLSASHGSNYSWNTKGGWGYGSYLNLNLRPTTNFNLSFGPS